MKQSQQYAAMKDHDAWTLDNAAAIVKRRKVSVEAGDTSAVARALKAEADACRAEAKALRAQP